MRRLSRVVAPALEPGFPPDPRPAFGARLAFSAAGGLLALVLLASSTPARAAEPDAAPLADAAGNETLDTRDAPADSIGSRVLPDGSVIHSTGPTRGAGFDPTLNPEVRDEVPPVLVVPRVGY